MEESVICIHENYDYMLCKYWKDRNSVTSGKIFKIYPEKYSTEMNWKVNKNECHKNKRPEDDTVLS